MQPPSISQLRDDAIAAFREAFGGSPGATAHAPGRVNLIGEHTDYNEGFVLPIAIDRWTVAAAALVDDPGASAVAAPSLGPARSFDPSRPLAGLKPGDPALYAAGAATLALEVAGARCGVRIALASSVPLGAGLSSSAAVEVACLRATLSLLGHEMSPLELVRLAQRAEHEFPQVPCGIMDQYVSVMAREGSALLIDCRDLSSRAVPMPARDRAALLVCDSGVRHALADGAYRMRRESCERVAGALSMPSLRDVELRDLEVLQSDRAAGLQPEDPRRARHVISENARTIEAAHALEAGDLLLAGRLMTESHASLRDDYEVSCAELDELVEIALATPGVFGARLTGAGFGGCAIALVEPAAIEQLERRWARTDASSPPRQPLRVLPAAGALSDPAPAGSAATR
ncbi:MAG: galactokinase [Phycisphaerales bacterium JB039]